MKYYDLSPRNGGTQKKAYVNKKRDAGDGRAYIRDAEYILEKGGVSAVVREYYYRSFDWDGVYEAMGEDAPTYQSYDLTLNEGQAKEIFVYTVDESGVGKRLGAGEHRLTGKLIFLSSQKFGEVDDREWGKKLWLLAWLSKAKLEGKYTTVGYAENCVLQDLMRTLMEDLLGADVEKEAHFLILNHYMGAERKMKETLGWSSEEGEEIYERAYNRFFPT